MTSGRFRIVEGIAGEGAAVVALQGELDAHTAEGFVDDVLASARPDDVLTLDVSGLEFIDSAGLRALVELEQRLRADGRRLRLDAPSDSVVRVLQIADLDHRFGVA